MPRVANIAFCVFYRKCVVVFLQVVFSLEIVCVVAAPADPRASHRVGINPIVFVFFYSLWHLFFSSVAIKLW